MNPALPGLIAIFLYLLGSYTQVRNVINRTIGSQSDLFRFLLPALIFHGLFVYTILVTESGVDLSFFNVAVLISLTINISVPVSYTHLTLPTILLV